jgi:hypothetical protein
MAANPESLKAWTKDDIEEIAGAIDEDEMHPRQTLRRLVNRLRGRLKMKHPQGYAAYLPEPLQKGLDAATQPPPDASGGDEHPLRVGPGRPNPATHPHWRAHLLAR